MASTKKPIISELSIKEAEKLKTTEQLLNETQSFISDYRNEAKVIDLELEKQKQKLADDIKRKQDAITEIFNKRAKEQEQKRLDLANDVYKKHKKRFGTKKELKEKPYDELLELFKEEPKSIWITVKKMLNL